MVHSCVCANATRRTRIFVSIFIFPPHAGSRIAFVYGIRSIHVPETCGVCIAKAYVSHHHHALATHTYQLNIEEHFQYYSLVLTPDDKNVSQANDKLNAAAIATHSLILTFHQNISKNE